MQKTDRELIIISGANGSGKTTFAMEYMDVIDYEFLNADEIAKEIEKENPNNALIKAGRIFFKRLNDCIKEHRSFVIETTLSGTYINKVAIRARENGYKLIMIYLFLDDPKLCIERVNIRVLKGGHNVPIEDIVRRFYRSKNNFWNNFTDLADSWSLIYNGDKGFQQVAIGEGQEQEYSIENPELFKKFKNISNEGSE